MKLIISIVDDEDADPVIAALTDRHFGVTHISTTADMLGPGSSTLLIGVENPDVDQVMKLIGEIAGARTEYVAYTHPGGIPFTGAIEVEVGGVIAFALDVYHFEQV